MFCSPPLVQTTLSAYKNYKNDGMLRWREAKNSKTRQTYRFPDSDNVVLIAVGRRTRTEDICDDRLTHED